MMVTVAGGPDPAWRGKARSPRPLPTSTQWVAFLLNLHLLLLAVNQLPARATNGPQPSLSLLGRRRRGPGHGGTAEGMHDAFPAAGFLLRPAPVSAAAPFLGNAVGYLCHPSGLAVGDTALLVPCLMHPLVPARCRGATGAELPWGGYPHTPLAPWPSLEGCCPSPDGVHWPSQRRRARGVGTAWAMLPWIPVRGYGEREGCTRESSAAEQGGRDPLRTVPWLRRDPP